MRDLGRTTTTVTKTVACASGFRQLGHDADVSDECNNPRNSPLMVVSRVNKWACLGMLSSVNVIIHLCSAGSPGQQIAVTGVLRRNHGKAGLETPTPHLLGAAATMPSCHPCKWTYTKVWEAL